MPRRNTPFVPDCYYHLYNRGNNRQTIFFEATNYLYFLRGIKKYLLLILRGMGMGAADVVPGVSGGTIAFITGIYEELVNSIKSINLQAIRLFFTGRWTSFWNQINGNFLLAVFAGIVISVLSLAKVLEYLLDEHPVLIWSFFFGLILASSYVVSRKIKRWDYPRIVALVGGIGIAFYMEKPLWNRSVFLGTVATITTSSRCELTQTFYIREICIASTP